ncbi:hypothetical protein [Paenibacillus sp. NAIST15-1]|nr:hypothetical protein [Paenibacillus sp. NAIST15-1]
MVPKIGTISEGSIPVSLTSMKSTPKGVFYFVEVAAFAVHI